ncbi:MAG: hypothetical protein GC190_20495 [Alphaproteobacteria bacterium]|nr:hypothetical protein [Alphaproteobacteria bacterium]
MARQMKPRSGPSEDHQATGEGLTDEPKIDTEGKTVHEAMATERDLEHWVGEIEVATDNWETVKADASAARKAGKNAYDARVKEAVLALQSRGIDKAMLLELLAEKKLSDAENSQRQQNKLWAQRALKIKPAQRTFIFPGTVNTEADALERCDKAGFADGKAGRDQDPAYQPNTPQGQSYLAGYNRGVASNVQGADNSETTAAVH